MWKKTSRKDRGDKWWWNEEVKNAIAEKKVAFKELCRSSSEINKTKYKRARNHTRKVVAKAMREETQQELIICINPNNVFKFLKAVKRKERP